METKSNTIRGGTVECGARKKKREEEKKDGGQDKVINVVGECRSSCNEKKKEKKRGNCVTSSPRNRKLRLMCGRKE